MATIGDGQIPRMNGSLIDYYDADIQTATDYYSYGMVMPGRSFNAGSYRYGFNGKENDNEVKGTGNQQDYGARIYDPRLGKFLSVDPLYKKYPNESNYAFVSNNPIVYVDPDGMDRIVYTRTIGKDGTVALKVQKTTGLFRSVHNNTLNGLGYFTKNDYIVYKTIDYRSDKPIVTNTETIVYPNAKEIGFGEYLKIKASGKDGSPLDTFMPQLYVFGSGSSDPGWGSKANPDRPITAVNYTAFMEIMDLINAGKEVPDLSSADPEKIPDLLNKAKDLHTQNSSDDKNVAPLRKPVLDTQYAPSKGVERDANGRVKRYTVSYKETIKSGNESPDTIRTTIYKKSR